MSTGLLQRWERLKVQGSLRGSGQGSRPRGWVRHQGLNVGPIHLISREKAVAVVGREDNGQ